MPSRPPQSFWYIVDTRAGNLLARRHKTRRAAILAMEEWCEGLAGEIDHYRTIEYVLRPGQMKDSE